MNEDTHPTTAGKLWLTIATLFTFVAVTVVAFVPVMFLLFETPAHDGSDVPSPFLLGTSLGISLVLGAWSARRLVRWWRRRRGS